MLLVPLRMEIIVMPYLVYILECADGSYYTGSTDDINKRLWQHEQGTVPYDGNDRLKDGVVQRNKH